MSITLSRRAFLCVAALATSRLAADPHPAACPPITARDLAKMDVSQYPALFAAGTAEGLPVGLGRGRVLYQAEARCPKLRARMDSTMWRGKYFYPDGRFTNQFIGFRAIESRAWMGTSWHDLKPAVILEYPPNAPFFGNNRDELRQIAPGVWLARIYGRCPEPRFTGWFVLTFDECGG